MAVNIRKITINGIVLSDEENDAVSFLESPAFLTQLSRMKTEITKDCMTEIRRSIKSNLRR